MKYVVRVTEILSQSFIVEANSRDDAEDKVSEAYNNGEIRLDYDDFYCYDIDTIREASETDAKYHDELEVEK